MERCLIVGCSRTKNETPGLLPAIDRYNGPEYRVIRRFLAKAPTAIQIDLFILSAEFGLISCAMPIPAYDRLMTPGRAEELRPEVSVAIREQIRPQGYQEVFISMGKVYRSALAGAEMDLLGVETRVVVSDGPMGMKLARLNAWLWSVGREMEPTSSRGRSMPATRRKTELQKVTLRGQTVNLATDGALSILQSALEQDWDAAHSIRNWYVEVAGERLSPKWAASHLFDLPVSKFSADEARRVLALLGMECHQL